MMRKIKFRIYQPIDKKFYYWGFTEDGAFRGIPTGANLSIKKCQEMSQQYTDLKDKNGNGKEIYRGDIISFPYVTPMGDIGDEENEYSYYGEVVFENGSYFVKPIKSDCGFWNKQYLYNIIKQNGYIIGNIDENPELLKGK